MMSTVIDDGRPANDDAGAGAGAGAGAANLPAMPGLSQDTLAGSPKLLRQSVASTWAEDNLAAITERWAWIETYGTPLSDVQVLPID